MKIPVLVSCLILVIGVLFVVPLVRGDETTDLDQQLSDTKSKLDAAVAEKKQTEKKLQQLESQKKQYEGTLNYLNYSYTATLEQLKITQQSLEQKKADLEKTNLSVQETELQLTKRKSHLFTTIRELYKNRSVGWFTLLLPRSESRIATHTAVYQQAVTDEGQQQAAILGTELGKLQEIKAILDQIKVQLEEDSAQLAAQQTKLQQSISTTQKSLATATTQKQSSQQSLVGIESKISDLTQRQRDILAAKVAAALASTTVGNQEINRAAIDKTPPQDGAVYFSFWTYGYPHRVGLSQYGAFGRAKSGQNTDQIIHAYYAGVSIVDWDGPDNIILTTGQTIPFEEDYLMGIGEMPSCWGSPDRGGYEALKVQAILARTYAIAYTDNGNRSICTDQNCQVYVGASKVQGTCGQYWQQAVNDTRNRVITYDNQPIQAWYSSTTGGFTLSSAEVWGGARAYAQGIKDFNGNDPYEGPKYGDSPWYYKAWGNEPWLSINQVTELSNAALLPVSYNNQITELSHESIISALNQSGIETISNLKALEIIDQNGGVGANTAQTAYLRVYYGDGKMVAIEGSRFKFVYNLRSPGTNAIWTTRFDVITAAEL